MFNRLKDFIVGIINFALWNMMLADFGWCVKHLPKSAIKAQAAKHCSVAAQLEQYLHGGVIVSTIRNDQGNMVQGHFMNLERRDSLLIYDRFGSMEFCPDGHKRWEIGDELDFGNGMYTIVDIQSEFRNFKIRNFNELIAYTKCEHAKLGRGTK